MHHRPLSVAALLLACTSPLAAQEAPIVQPGAPGQQGKQLSAEEARDLADTRFSPDDVAFMQGMIHHHQQAVDMVALVEARTNNETLRAAADRIRASQSDEIAFMQNWLRQRGQAVPQPGKAGDHAGHSMTGGAMAGHASMQGMATPAQMQGMATPAQMQELATLKGTAFDRMFLNLMIAHHEGAIDMVDDLLDQPGSAYDPVLFEFTNDVTNEQQSEIDRMNVLLAGLSNDARAQLAAGLTDPGVAAKNMRLVKHLPKPAGFFDPANPGGLQPEIVKADAEAAKTPTDAASSDGKEGTQFGERSSLLSFANTDMAFQGDLMVAGNYHGFNVYRLDKDGIPGLVSSVVCPGGQGDISLVGDILIMSVEQTRGRVDCGLQGVKGDVSADRFRGLRIFDISNPAAPVQVGQVQTCRGSHTHSVVDADRNRIVVYNSGTASVRDEEELAGCVGDVPGDQNTALFSIDVVEIPLADPGQARIVDRPRVFAEDGQIAGLWRGGDHGEGTQRTNRTDQCHDITVFPAKKIAAGACSGNGILLDISDPMKPKRIAAVSDPGFAYWHSATFNNDGTKVIFTDEWGGGARPRCRTYDPRGYGADAIYDIEGNTLVRRGTYKLPAPQGDMENCVAHNGSAVPVPGRDIFVQAWYQGGISVIDFTDSANPKEIAYFDRGPIDDKQLVLGGFWSAYYYNGKIYGTEIARGLDVLALEPSEELSQAEIAAAAAAQYPGGVFNPQTQYSVTWPQAALDAVEKERKGG